MLHYKLRCVSVRVRTRGSRMDILATGCRMQRLPCPSLYLPCSEQSGEEGPLTTSPLPDTTAVSMATLKSLSCFGRAIDRLFHLLVLQLWLAATCQRKTKSCSLSCLARERRFRWDWSKRQEKHPWGGQQRNARVGMGSTAFDAVILRFSLDITSMYFLPVKSLSRPWEILGS